MNKKCLHCEKTDLETTFVYKNSKFCNDPECQEAKKAHAKEMTKQRNKIKCEEIKNEKIIYKSERKCLKCGCDPAPNYFYCGKNMNNCHESV